MYTLELWNICIIDPRTIFCCNKKEEKRGLFSIPLKHNLFFISVCSAAWWLNTFFAVKGERWTSRKPCLHCLLAFRRMSVEEREVKHHARESGSALRLHHCLHRIAAALGAGGTAAQERGDSCSAVLRGGRRNPSPAESRGREARFILFAPQTCSPI